MYLPPESEPKFSNISAKLQPNAKRMNWVKLGSRTNKLMKNLKKSHATVPLKGQGHEI